MHCQYPVICHHHNACTASTLSSVITIMHALPVTCLSVLTMTVSMYCLYVGVSCHGASVIIIMHALPLTCLSVLTVTVSMYCHYVGVYCHYVGMYCHYVGVYCLQCLSCHHHNVCTASTGFSFRQHPSIKPT